MCVAMFGRHTHQFIMVQLFSWLFFFTLSFQHFFFIMHIFCCVIRSPVFIIFYLLLVLPLLNTWVLAGNVFFSSLLAFLLLLLLLLVCWCFMANKTYLDRFCNVPMWQRWGMTFSLVAGTRQAGNVGESPCLLLNLKKLMMTIIVVLIL